MSIYSCRRIQDSDFVKYPSLDLYKKDYSPGDHEELNFNGYYDHSVVIYNRTNYGKKIIDPVQPLFFFSDGSVCYDFMGSEKDSLFTYLNKPEKMSLTWGNYKVIEDTIIIESLQWSQGYIFMKYKKLVEKGIIYQDSIYVFEIQGANYINKRTLYFSRFDRKPDSTLNWIRKTEYYN